MRIVTLRDLTLAGPSAIRSSVHTRIDALARREWNGLAGAQIPFLRHEFLGALEHTECVGALTGWEPRYFVLHDAQGLAAAVPAYVKLHSYGEFVFDFAWAQAYARAGGNYYPKLTIAVPFTPATGPRFLLRPGVDPKSARRLLEEVQRYAIEHEYSSVHALFLDEAARALCAKSNWLLRRDCQFHWQNRGYGSFEDYLATFTAEKRKKVRRERRRVAEDGIRFETRFGADLDKRLLDQVYAMHRDTFWRHGHEPYLTRAFFGEIAQSLGEAFMVKLALRGRTPVAAAIFFWCQEALFGRYWGAAADFHSLHFETCYHQGIEFCIERGIARFEPGTQGEHKVSRGFEPAITWSAHFIRDARFRAAIGDYLKREGESVDEYADAVQSHVPYRATPDGGGT
jgi:predicted N-acyltransferase